MSSIVNENLDKKINEIEDGDYQLFILIEKTRSLRGKYPTCNPKIFIKAFDQEKISPKVSSVGTSD
jgi:hypothetical protein